MTNLDQESLFSLELIVDRLCLYRSVECRIPAVAFRLLDFPTLLIYHVEPELVATVRSKLLKDRYQPIPAQLNELKDRKTGAFLISRGKSCLFRVSPTTLVSSLSSTPLYVMVVDMFPETPKLVGSSGIPLSSSAHDLYNSIVTSGISVPAVQAEKKELDVCDLMGTKRGTVLLGYRILSLGAALLSHIPTHNIIHIAKREVDEHFCSTGYVVPQMVSDEPYITAKQSTNVEASDSAQVDKILRKTFADSQTQMEPCSFHSVGTHTAIPRPHTDKQSIQPVHYTDDLITTNIVCPPPLFYNSTTCKKTVCWNQEWSSGWEMAADGTIRMEDKYLDTEDKYLDADVKATRDDRENEQPHLAQNYVVRNNLATRTSNHPGHVTEFPVLSALMAEILQLQGMNLVQDSSGRDADHEDRYRIQKVTRGIEMHNRDPEKAVEMKKSAHKFANLIPCEKCEKRLVVPKQSSAPLVQSKPFFAGVTKTQKLRLAKVNPKLLQSIETKEMQRRNEFRTACASRMRQKEKVPSDYRQNVDEIDNFKHIDISRTAEYGRESRESTARYKCPVPTPRTSKILINEDDLTETNIPDADRSGFSTKTFMVDHSHKRVEPRLLQQSSSEQNSTLPLMQSECDRSACYGWVAMTNTAADSNIAGRQVASYPRLNPSGSDDSEIAPASAPVVHKDDSAGTTQLEAIDAGNVLTLEDLGLRKIMDHYSSDSDDGDETEVSNNDESKDRDAACHTVKDEEESDHKLSEDREKEPEHLRRVVNQYSDAFESEQSDLEYEYDFEDTPAQSLKTISTMNSAASSTVGSSVPQRTEDQKAGTNVKMSNHSQPITTIGEK